MLIILFFSQEVKMEMDELSDENESTHMPISDAEDEDVLSSARTDVTEEG
jgi:hypothetical protein